MYQHSLRNVTLTNIHFYNAHTVEYLGVSENHVRTAGMALLSEFLVSKDNPWSGQQVLIQQYSGLLKKVNPRSLSRLHKKIMLVQSYVQCVYAL